MHVKQHNIHMKCAMHNNTHLEISNMENIRCFITDRLALAFEFHMICVFLKQFKVTY